MDRERAARGRDALVAVLLAAPACSGTESLADAGKPRAVRTRQGVVVELGPREVLLGNDALALPLERSGIYIGHRPGEQPHFMVGRRVRLVR